MTAIQEKVPLDRSALDEKLRRILQLYVRIAEYRTSLERDDEKQAIFLLQLPEKLDSL